MTNIDTVCNDPRCRHCGGEAFVLWELNIDPETHEPHPTSESHTVHTLIEAGHLSPTAFTMTAHDVMHQFNNVNGGEVWLITEGDDLPWLCLRTELNSDGTAPKEWTFFAEDEKEARMWLDSGQVDAIKSPDEWSDA